MLIIRDLLLELGIKYGGYSKYLYISTFTLSQ